MQTVSWLHLFISKLVRFFAVLTLFLALSTGDAVLAYLGRFLYLQVN